jgi:ABC-2 type transport system permease protein
MVVTEVTVTAMDSWVQFFKNIPMALIAFVLLEGGILTGEYQSGTLVLSLTKGLKRHQVLGSKAMVLTLLWTVCYWLCFAITYGYNAYFWDNGIAKNLLFSVLCWWVFGLWTIALLVFFSTVSMANTGVLLGTGGVAFGSYLVGMLPKVSKYLPTHLTDGNSLIYAAAETDAYTVALIISAVTALACFVGSLTVFNKKQL